LRTDVFLSGIPSDPSSLPSPGAAAPTDGAVRAGDIFELKVGSPVAPIYSPVRVADLAPYLYDSGIATDVDVAYISGPPHSQGQGKLLITGVAADNWRSGGELCGEVLRLVAETGYSISPSNWLSCIITPTAPAMPKFEVPGWLILLLLGGALWLWWKSAKEKP
jgi:hypothetical protein